MASGMMEGMVLLIVLLILILLLAGAGFALHVLWIVAIVLFIAWLIGLVLNRR